MNHMNFNEHIKRELINEFAGSEKKKTILLDDGNKYLLKFPDPTREKKNELSYINNAISEYIGCKIIKSLSLPVQEVILGEYTDERGKTKIACACKDVRLPGEIMHEIQTVNLSSLDDDTKKDASLKNAMEFAENFGLISSKKIKEFYYDMFVADAFLGNTDRHNGNWAVLTDSEGNARMSPIYDCGSSLSPLLDDEQLDYRHMSSDAMNTFSAILDENNKRIGYKDYLLSCENKDLNEAIKRIVERINMKNVNKIIDDIPYISEKRKSFYKDMLSMRYEKILIPALQKNLSRNQEEINKCTENLSIDDLKDFSANKIGLIRNADNYTMYEAKFGVDDDILKFRKVNNKLAILYDKHNTVTGVAPIRKDYQEVKAFIFELTNAIEPEIKEQEKEVNNNDIPLDTKKKLDENDKHLIDDDWKR